MQKALHCFASHDILRLIDICHPSAGGLAAFVPESALAAALRPQRCRLLGRRLWRRHPGRQQLPARCISRARWGSSCCLAPVTTNLSPASGFARASARQLSRPRKRALLPMIGFFASYRTDQILSSFLGHVATARLRRSLASELVPAVILFRGRHVSQGLGLPEISEMPTCLSCNCKTLL